MIFERTILEALTEEPRGPVVVRGHVRKKPVNPKREEVLSALRRLRSSVPTAPASAGCSRQVAS